MWTKKNVKTGKGLANKREFLRPWLEAFSPYSHFVLRLNVQIHLCFLSILFYLLFRFISSRHSLCAFSVESPRTQYGP